MKSLKLNCYLMDVTVTCKLDVSMKNHYSITNTESKSRLSDAKGLNEANIYILL